MPNLARIYHPWSFVTDEANLNTQELKAFYQLIEQCHRARTVEEINTLLCGPLRNLIPHTMCAYGIGDQPDKKVVVSINLGFPEAYLQTVINEHQLLSSPIAKQWSETSKPVLMTTESIPSHFPAIWQKTFRDNNINSILVHGLTDMAGKKASYFAFANFTNAPGEKEKHIIELLTPHLHVALCNTLEKTQVAQKTQIISKRETEILKWVYNGKTNSEIGDLLYISEFTVKNHIKNILDKLGAANRTHAVAKAVSLGILEVEI